MFLQLGTYKFEGIKLPQSWTTSNETTYGQINIIGGKPIVQQVGETLNEIELGIFLSTDFCTPKDEIESLQAIRKGGIVNNLIDGTGKNYGKYVITTIGVDNIQTDSDGYPIAISATLKLLEYNTTTAITKRTGKAYANSKPIPVEPLTPIVSPIRGVMVSLQEGQNMSKGISGAIKQGQMTAGKAQKLQQMADANIKKYNDTTNAIAKSAKAARRGAAQIRGAINTANHIITNIKILATKIQHAEEQIRDLPGTIRSAETLQDYVDLANNGELLSSASYVINVAGTPFVGLIASREGGL